MDIYHVEQGSTFDPTFALARERIGSRQQEANADRLAARSTAVAPTPLRARLGTVLIAIGSSLVTPTASRRPSLTD